MLHYYYRKVPVQSTGTSYNQGNMYCCQLSFYVKYALLSALFLCQVCLQAFQMSII